MRYELPGGMRDAMRLTKAGRLTEATALIQRLLGGEAASPAASPDPDDPLTIDGVAEEVRTAEPARPVRALAPDRIRPDSDDPDSVRPGLPGTGPVDHSDPVGPDLVGPRPVGPRPVGPNDVRPNPVGARETPATPRPGPRAFALPGDPDPGAAGLAPGRFLDASYSSAEGSRAYKLYVPTGYRAGQPLPLVVMLHGCTQTPEDFAAGTRMNALAETHGCLVAWPAQTSAANPNRCWNWFQEKDQGRTGEPALIAGITRQVMRTHVVDASRVYVAGLSAGGAAAAILAETYPELYAAAGVHSGLPRGAARDVASAFAAMRRGAGAASRHDARARNGTGAHGGPGVGCAPLIVFHGDRDTTVHPANGEAVTARAVSGRALQSPLVKGPEEKGRMPGGHAWRRIPWRDGAGTVQVEHWIIEGAAHAWSGGARAGSYTDPLGPDASAEMLRFFLEHPRG